jgi:multisubunit Na+/H+ antiporter MnhB subunit
LTFQRDDPPAVTTALSTLTARIAVLERWMRRSQRRETALLVLIVVGLLVTIALMIMR